MVRIRSVNDYFKEYAVEGIAKGMDRFLVRRQLIDAFQKEIFGLVAMRAKKQFDEIPEDGDPEARRIAQNVVKEATKKWISLCKMFDKYKETSRLLHWDDISLTKNENEEVTA